MKTAIVMGTRPEIIKLATVIKKLPKKDCSVIFTGQHYDYHMGLKFVEQLGIRKPDFSLKITKTSSTVQMAQIISKLGTIFEKIKPENVIVQGDTNTVLAASISSLKSRIPISHIESGLRSFDWRMPEEHNRIAVDHISELLFAPTQNSKQNLLNEKVHGKISVTGNTVIDALKQFSNLSKKKSTLTIDNNDYVLLTCHRSENVDDKKTLSSIVKAIYDSGEKFFFPIHPRTVLRLKNFNLYEKLRKASNVKLINSVGYFEMLELMKNCMYIVTDSGGIQEEATSPKIRKKVLIIRKTTDRPEAINSGFAELVGLSYSKIKDAIHKTSKNPKIKNKKSPFGDGNATEKILKVINNSF